MKKKGFTLIELLAVIVILAIIAVIATPIITGIIEDSKKASFERSTEGIIKGLEFDVAFKLGDSGYTYRIIDGDIMGLDENSNVSISNTKGFNGTVIYDSEANVSYAIHNDKWCAMKIGNDITTTDYIEGECVISTPEACFTTNYILESYEIGDNCENYFVNNGWSQEDAKNICNGGTLYGTTLKEQIEQGYLDVEELQTNNVIKNVVMKDEVSIASYGYDVDTCGVDVVIPSKINNKKVVAIGEFAFNYNQLTNVTIPSSVTSIGRRAFSYNQLTSVEIPDSVTSIGDAAFNNNQLPDNEAFIYKRNSDGSIDNTTIVSYGGAKRNNVTIPNSVIIIGDEAFSGNQLTSVEIPNSVTRIGYMAFSHNQLTSVEIPDSVTSIGYMAFNNNQLPDNEAFIYKRNSDGSIDNTTIVSYGGAKRNNVTIPNNVIIIGDEAFSNISLTSVEIPNSVTSIGKRAFCYNHILSWVTIGNSVTNIGDEAFAGNSLTSVEIPSSVTSIGKRAFNKDDYFNKNLTVIINKTDKSFDWGSIINETSGYNFKTGTVVNRYGNVEITSEFDI